MAMTFDEISSLDIGDEFYDRTLRLVVNSKPRVFETKNKMGGDPLTQVEFNAIPYGSDFEERYLFTKELMHYSPRIHKYKAYSSPEDLQENKS